MEQTRLDQARRYLSTARKHRGRGGHEGVRLCIEAAHLAHTHGVAAWVEDGCGEGAEIAYHAHAAVGRLHRYRAEHGPALDAYRRALRTAEEMSFVPEVHRWLAPAYHDCYVEARCAGQFPVQFAKWAEGRLEGWEKDPDSRLYAYVHDYAYLGLTTHTDNPQHLHDTALGAIFKSAAFDRMVVYASMALAAGEMHNSKWFLRSVHLFEASLRELDSDEAVALQLLDVAAGAEALGEMETAMDALARARNLAALRQETIVRERATSRIAVLVGIAAGEPAPEPQPLALVAAL